MSFHTRIWVHPFDGEPINVASVRPALAAFLDESGIHHDTLKSLDAACASALPSFEPTLFFLNSYFLVTLFEYLAQQLPHASFAVQGIGEEARDIWVREFSGGTVQFEAGPFTE